MKTKTLCFVTVGLFLLGSVASAETLPNSLVFSTAARYLGVTNSCVTRFIAAGQKPDCDTVDMCDISNYQII